MNVSRKATIDMKNGHKLVVEVYGWDDDHDDISVYVEKDGGAYQDIAVVREAKDSDGVEVMVYADENNEDYTHEFHIKEYKGD